MTGRSTGAALVGLLAVFLGGCCGGAGGVCASTSVPELFSERYLCPRERIVVRERPDLPYHRFVCTGPAGTSCGVPSLPVDVADDPERLALWRKLAREKLDEADAQSSGALEVSGCGQHDFYACGRKKVRQGYIFDCTRHGLVLLRHESGEPAPDSWPLTPKP
jgi:hypothetical protein